MSQLICPNCGTVGRPKTVVKGSLLTELVLWLFFLLPGIIYSAWRLTSRAKVCPACGAGNMIPLTSPKGKKLQSEFSLSVGKP
jgi:predicted RNA-binding Zn-ribbon protein involved in translation (DUF1610 family)